MLPYAEKVGENEEERPHSPEYYEKKEQQIKWTDKVLLNRPSKVIFLMLILSILLPLLLYTYVLSSTLDVPPADEFSHGSCTLSRSSRLPCGKANVSRSSCHAECCYDPSNDVCYHRIPSRFSYISEGSWSEDVDLRPRISTEPFAHSPTISTLRLSVDEASSTHLTLTFYDPTSFPHMRGRRIDEKDYDYDISYPELAIDVHRSNDLIFSTIRGPLIAALNIWEITFKLTNDSMHGLGQIPLIANSSRVFYSNKESPDVIPLIYAKSNGTYHGVLVDNMSPTELTVLEDNQLIVRSIETSSLKIHIFVGPEPKDIMSDVMKLIGFENNLNYWMLGAHICTEVADSEEEALEDLTDYLREARAQNLPFDSHCGTSAVVLDTRCNAEFSYMEKGKELVKGDGKRFVPHLSPYILHEPDNITNENSSENTTIATGLSDTFESSCYNNTISHFGHILIADPDSESWYGGLVDDFRVLYPDYRSENSSHFIRNFWRLGDFDGVILQNSWPLDESLKLLNETTASLPYFNENFKTAFNSTIPWNAVDSDGQLHLYRHNDYGNKFHGAIKALTDDSIPVWSTAHWMNGNVVSNRQNKDASWANLHRELMDAALAGISGNRYWSSLVCGDARNFNADTQTSLCIKWYMAATYMPLIKIHSKEIPRHPLAFSGTNRNHMINALRRRTSLMPYFYTVLRSGPLLRPMFYQYPKSERLENINTQFNVGDDLLIVPNLLPSQSIVNVWLPPGVWYELWSGLKLEHDEEEPVAMTTTEADFLTLLRGGAIIMLQELTSQKLLSSFKMFTTDMLQIVSNLATSQKWAGSAGERESRDE
ncbi:Alpha-glucosidase 2 [Eumeta japonica]|uniref:Alpha-glucosidase 2 n=1 Tax=Eumeta variegata TaxID=151549 RepID=A0A4C2AES1_EUMVA|nr:Alpha-glucosidase 2 [Eumeta japonica]